MNKINNFALNSDSVAKALAAYIKTSNEKKFPAIRQRPTEELIEILDLENLLSEGSLDGETLQKFVETYLQNTTRLHHPGFLAHQVATPHPTGALGSFIDGATNNAMAVYEMGPAASSIEYFMVNWMLEKIGWKTVACPEQGNENSDHAGGVLTHGGSLANLTALLAARSAKVPDFWKKGNPGNLVVLVPEQSHYSMKRSVAIIGLGEDNCLTLPADEDGRVLPEEIPLLLEDLKSQGKQVMAIVANACGTAAGLYDPLDPIASLCEEHNIWLHVDAAHGGGALVSKKLRPLMAGIERADSVIWDAHKMLRSPTLCAAILMRDHRHLDQAFEQEASYLFHEKDQPGFDFMARTVECTKSGLGLKLFMTLAAMGEQGLEDHVNQMVEMAQKSANLFEAQDDFEIAIRPETNILCFRTGTKDSVQMEIRRRLLEKGDFYFSTTLYKGQRWMRLVFMNPVVEMRDVEELIEEIRVVRDSL